MSITYMKRIDNGASNNLVQVITNDSTATATASGYLTAQAAVINTINEGGWTWLLGDMVLLVASDGDTWCTLDSTFTTLVSYVSLAPINQVVTISSATPGTVRAATFDLVETMSITSGNIVGVRGAVNYVGASGSSFVYGVQGKLIPTGTLAASSWNAAVFGQFDIHAATITSGQLATLWGDMGTTATSGTYTGLYGIAMTNTTAAIANAQVYLYGGATNLLELADNNGLVGATYFVAAGTSAGSAGDAAHCAAAKVLKITVNGTNYWLPLFASNS